MKSFFLFLLCLSFTSTSTFANIISCRGSLFLLPRIAGNEVVYTLSKNPEATGGTYRILWGVSEDQRIVISGKDDKDNFLTLDTAPGTALLGSGEEFPAQLGKLTRLNSTVPVTCRIVRTVFNF